MAISMQNFETDTLVILKRCDYETYLKKFCAEKKRLCQIQFYQKNQNIFLCRILRRFQWYQPFKRSSLAVSLVDFFEYAEKTLISARSPGCSDKFPVLSVNIFSGNKFACFRCFTDPGDIFNRKNVFDMSCV